ncbi:MAG: hypothetical protein Q4C70_10275 [Planctomycetia bacterium]|nr:hypothetical protein [Planctomycetia bacterium]
MSASISSKTRLELARELNIAPETIRNWLKTGVVQDESLETLRTVAETRLTRRVNRTHAVQCASTEVTQKRERGLENFLNIFRFYQGKEAQNPVFTEFFLFSCIFEYVTEKVSRLNRDMLKSLQEELSA